MRDVGGRLFISRASVWLELAPVLKQLLFLHLESLFFISNHPVWDEGHGLCYNSSVFLRAQSAPLTKLAQMILYCLFNPGIKAHLSHLWRLGKDKETATPVAIPLK